jgi:hypothetical protein
MAVKHFRVSEHLDSHGGYYRHTKDSILRSIENTAFGMWLRVFRTIVTRVSEEHATSLSR